VARAHQPRTECASDGGAAGGSVPFVQILRAAGHFAVPEGEPNQYREHLRSADLSIGTYCIPVGGKDGQDPHTAAEIYVVLRGRARLVSATGEAEVGPGSVIFLPAGEEHSFADVTEDLSILVVFGPSS
jgi:mannose-6-phosphate isomerase-like protein (cupin superfamily)